MLDSFRCSFLLRPVTFACLGVTLGCASVQAAPVVVYTAVDQEYAEIILKDAEAATGLSLKPVYDAESSKAVGLERRLVAEKARPKADVFWNSEYLRTARLVKAGVVVAPGSAKDYQLPDTYSSSGYVGLGLRARVLAVNTRLVPNPADRPQHLEDLLDPKWKGRIAVGKPLFASTATHFTALHAKWGTEKFVAFLKGLKANGIQVLPGNGDVRDAVADGRVAVGLTDSDDVLAGLRGKKPLALVFPDQDGDGAFTVFQTLTLVQGGPNAEGGRKLAAYLASAAVEKKLVEMGAVQIPVHTGLSMATELGTVRPKTWYTDPAQVIDKVDSTAELVKKHLL